MAWYFNPISCYRLYAIGSLARAISIGAVASVTYMFMNNEMLWTRDPLV
jgi:hypothetical protein